MREKTVGLGLTVMTLHREEGEGEREDCWTGLTVMRLHREEGEREDCWTGADSDETA